MAVVCCWWLHPVVKAGIVLLNVVTVVGGCIMLDTSFDKHWVCVGGWGQPISMKSGLRDF